MMPTTSATIEYPRRHAVSAAEYLRMGETGVFAPEGRLQLIQGEIFEKRPIGPPHAGAVNTLVRLFARLACDRAVVSVQDPFVLSDQSVPQPDIALLAPRADNYSAAHPTADDVLLVVEVADTTLAFDTGTKAPLYAHAGLRELWVVDVNDRTIRVYRDPSPSGYNTSFTVTGADTLASVGLPDVRILVSDVFPR